MENTIQQAAQQYGIDLAAQPLVAEFVDLVAKHVQHLPEPERSDRIRAVAVAIDGPAPNRSEHVLSALFPEGGAA